MTITTVPLGSTGVKVANVAHGLMLMTWKQPVVPDEQAFESIKAGLDLAGPGEKIVLNSAEFYGVEPKTANLELLSRFFDKYPEYTDKAFLAVKGGIARAALLSDSSPENLRASVEACIKALGPKKKLDVFQCARVDHRVPIEESIKTLKGLIQEGLFDHIGLSEASAETLRRAHKIHPIALIEIEVSPWSYEEETRKVIAAAKELGVSVLAYSPMGGGFLAGAVKKGSLHHTDIRSHGPRFQAEAYDTNIKFVEALSKISERKGISNAQLCIAWVASLGAHVIPLPGSSAAKRTLENFSSGTITLAEEEKKEIEHAMNTFEIVGTRYPEGHPVWG